MFVSNQTFIMLRCKPTLVPGTDYAQKRNVVRGVIHPQYNDSVPVGQKLGDGNFKETEH